MTRIPWSVIPLAVVGIALSNGSPAPAQQADAAVRFAPPTRLASGDAWLGEGRLYPSPVLHDVDGDGRPDVVVGDLVGKVTWARRGDAESAGALGKETPMTKADGKPLRFHNW